MLIVCSLPQSRYYILYMFLLYRSVVVSSQRLIYVCFFINFICSFFIFWYLSIINANLLYSQIVLTILFCFQVSPLYFFKILFIIALIFLFQSFYCCMLATTSFMLCSVRIFSSSSHFSIVIFSLVIHSILSNVQYCSQSSQYQLFSSSSVFIYSYSSCSLFLCFSFNQLVIIRYYLLSSKYNES